MLKKLIIPEYFSMLLLATLVSCSQNPQLEEPLLSQQRAALYPQPVSEPLPNTYLHTYAELIQPKTLNTFKHLSGYEGHALIGNSRIQAVISGVDPQAEQHIWTPLILAYFHRANGTWEKLESIFDTSFRRSVKGRPAATQIEAVVPSINQAYNSAHLDVVYSRAGGGSKREFLKLYLDEAADELLITVDTKTISKRTSKEKNRVTLRLNRRSGNAIRFPHGLIHYATNDVLAITGSQDFSNAITVEENNILLKSSGANAAGWEGFVIGIGPRAGAEAHFHAQSRESCSSNKHTATLAGEQSDLTKFFQIIRQCQSEFPKGELLVRLDSENSPLATSYRRFIITDTEDQQVGYSYGPPGTSLRFPLVSTQKYRVKEVSTGAEWGITTPIMVEEGGAEILSLSARKPAKVQVVATNETPAALMTVRSGTNPSGVNLTSDVILASEGTRMSDSIVLIRHWPVEMTLPPGKYSFEFFREGTANSICTFQTIISEEETKKLTCHSTKPKSMDVEATIDTDTPTDKASLASLKDALAVQRLTIDVGNVQNSQNAGPAIQKIEVFDPRTLLSLSSYPLDDEIIRKWRVLSNGLQKTDLALFARFIKEQAPDAILQLNCPANNLSASEFEAWLERLQPNAVQYYGCDIRSDTKQAFDALFRRSNPPLITPVSGLRNGTRSPYYPRLALNNSASPTPKSIHASLRNGNFVISAGSLIEVLEINASSQKEPQKRVTAHLRISSGERVVPLSVAVYAGTQIIYQKNLPLSSDAYIEETIEFFTVDTNVRFEVNGRLRDQQNNAILPTRFALASTNYLQISNVESSRDNQKETRR